MEPITTFHYEFDIAAIGILLVLFIINIGFKEMKNSSHYLFWSLLWVDVLTCVVDILAVEVFRHNGPGLLFNVLNSIFYIDQLFITLFFLQYIIARLVVKNRFSSTMKAAIFLPAFIYIIAIISNYWTHIVFLYDEGSNTYFRSNAGSVCIFIIAFYFATATFCVLQHRKVYDPHIVNVTYHGIAIMGITIILDYIFPQITFNTFGFALIIMLIYITLRNPNAVVNQKTGVPNDVFFYEYCRKLLFEKRDFSLTFVRIADYELFISTYGFDFATSLMDEISLSLSKEFKMGHLYSVGHNFFAIHVDNPKDVGEVQNKVKAILDQEWQIDETDIAFAYFIVSLNSPRDMKSIDDIMSYVTYIQRMHRKRYGILDASELELKDRIREKEIEQAISNGLANDYFEVYFQPIYSIHGQRFTTAEALIRLKDPSHGFISPAEFIPIAEQTGTIVQIGNLVMKKVFNFISECDIRGLGMEYIELNLSTIQCLQRNFMDNLYDILGQYSVDPHQVCFEITETAANCAPEIFDRNLSRLVKGGYKLALDDFGTGYSNLNRLVSSNFSIIKFDKTTVESTCADPTLVAPYEKLVQLIHIMNAKIVAEGVETEEQFRYLENAGVDYIQGYYFAKPMPFEDFVEFIATYNAR